MFSLDRTTRGCGRDLCRCAFAPPFLRVPEGRRFLSSLFCIQVNRLRALVLTCLLQPPSLVLSIPSAAVYLVRGLKAGPSPYCARRSFLRSCFFPFTLPGARSFPVPPPHPPSWTAQPQFTRELQAIVRNQIPNGRRSILEAYGEILFRVWRNATGPCLAELEYGCMQVRCMSGPGYLNLSTSNVCHICLLREMRESIARTASAQLLTTLLFRTLRTRMTPPVTRRTNVELSACCLASSKGAPLVCGGRRA